MDLAPLIASAVDDQPQKQGRFMPGSGISILSQSDALRRFGRESFVLLGVNGENERALIDSAPLLVDRMSASVLPPSDHLLEAWSRR